MESLRERASRRGQLSLQEVQSVLGVMPSRESSESDSGAGSADRAARSAQSTTPAAATPNANLGGNATNSSSSTGTNAGTSTGANAGHRPVGNDFPLSNVEVDLSHQHRKIKPRTAGQAGYVSAIRAHDLTFCRGPAGCGKTYLAVALAVEALKSRAARKIVLVRPAVEAGESLGFLPGDLQAKLNPYLRPLLDALNEMLDYDQVKYLMEHDVIEVIPLAYMRGRTLNDAFIILDEAQNTTSAQMKMFLTRMGEGSKIVVSGDVTQVDLPSGVLSGMRDAWRRLQGLENVAFVTLAQQDIVRHRLVQLIVGRYEQSSGSPPDASAEEISQTGD
ncbi:MAG: PhoH family protein [Pirellulaceae bacterium]|nr:PhoH family protein [Pirellulaceae bacterium]